MSKIVALIRRELAVYFVSPVAYIVLTVYLFVCGGYFWIEVNNAAGFNPQGSRSPFSFAGTFQMISHLALLITPLVTMRLIAEEKNRGTIESLMTAPVGDLQVVVSKFAGALLFFVFLLLPTLAYVGIMRYHEATVDWGATLTGYLGLLLFLALLVSLGLFISSLCDSQMVAAVVTLVVMVMLLGAGVGMMVVKAGSFWWLLLTYVNLPQRTASFSVGVIDTRDLVFFVSGTLFFIFGTTLVLESRRWR